MKPNLNKGLVTIPTDKDCVELTKKYIAYWGADAVRDCDGVELPSEVASFNTEVYKSYFIVREDHEYAHNHPEFVQNVALSSKRKVAFASNLEIDLLEGLFKESLVPNEDDYRKYYQVFDRTTGLLHDDYDYLGNGIVRINNTIKYHEYSVNFFAKNIWDPVQIYNYHSNGWNVPKDIDLDPAYPEARNHMLSRFESWLKQHNEVSVIRFTTFFYNFLILYKDGLNQVAWDWHNYAMSASPKMFELFEKENGYSLTLEDVVTSGTMLSRFEIPSKRSRAYIDFVDKKCAQWAKQFVDLAHKYGKKAIMFDGDHRIGAEPYNPYFASIGLDGVVGAPHSQTYLRMISDMEGVGFKEARLNPYFFPNECPSDEAGTNMVRTFFNNQRRGMLRKNIDRIGFGGYLKIADSYPNFTKAIKDVCDEFRFIKANTSDKGSLTLVRIAILSYWGKRNAWMINGQHVDDTNQDNEGYQALLEAIAGQPVDVSWVSFDEVINSGVISNFDVVITTGLVGSSFQGDYYWKNEALLSKIREYVSNGGGLIGIGDPSGYFYQGKYFQLSDIFGVEKEIGFTNFKRIKVEPIIDKTHFILKDINMDLIDFGSQRKNVYLKEGTPLVILDQGGYKNVTLAVNRYNKGRSVYLSSLMSTSYDAYRLIYKMIIWAANKEELEHRLYTLNPNIDIYYYEDTNTYIFLNNVNSIQESDYFDNKGNELHICLSPLDIKVIR